MKDKNITPSVKHDAISGARVQVFPNGVEVRTSRNTSTGMRVAKIARCGRVDIVPIGLLRCAAGPDAWMQNIQCKCDGCQTWFRSGDSDGEGYCQDCFDKQGEENERLDGNC